VHDEPHTSARFAAITYNNSASKFMFSTRHYDNKASSYICQLQQQGLFRLY